MERDGLVGPADGSRPRELLKAPGWLHEVALSYDQAGKRINVRVPHPSAHFAEGWETTNLPLTCHPERRSPRRPQSKDLRLLFLVLRVSLQLCHKACQFLICKVIPITWVVR